MFLPSNSSLQHLAEKVLWNLEMKDLKICAQINQFCKQILKNPIFCLKKFRQLSNNLYININEFQPWRSLISRPAREVSS